MRKNEKYKHRTIVDINSSASIVAPKIMEWFAPKTVVDVGCGLGSWLKAFADLGVTQIMGLDGQHLNRQLLCIPEQYVVEHDLEKPFPYSKKFDLVISLEVAEHLSKDAADTYVKTLVDLGEVILFSAAIPNQGGQNHINERWISYWQEKFAKHQYHFYDVLRPVFWNNPRVKWYYRQNMFLIIKEGVVHSFEKNKPILDLVHPDLFTERMEHLHLVKGNMSLRRLSKIWLRAFANELGLLALYRKMK
jgi:SAM-dependent methyltransferase